MLPDLTTLQRIDEPLERMLQRIARWMRTDFVNDSGNQVYGVEVDGRRWFIKHADRPDRVASFRRAEALYAAVDHPALPALRNAFDTPTGRALLYEWVEGEPLREAAPRARWEALSVAERLSGVGAILDLHVAIAEAGFVAEDLYDGCFLYDFASHRMWVCDLDEYRPGPYRLDRDRTYGSTRFRAPEEYRRGARLDERTTVFNLARVAAVLLGDRAGRRDAFTGPDSLWSVIAVATAAAAADRYATVRGFVEAWMAAAH